MAKNMNRFSSASRGTPVVAEANGAGRDSESAAQLDPAPADLDEEYRERLLAYEEGKRAKTAGRPRNFIASHVKRVQQLDAAWDAGWLGEAMPEGDDR